MQISASTVSIISLVISAICCIVSVLNSRRSRRTDDRKESSELTTIAVRLETINSGINELKSDVRYVSSEQQSMRERLVLVEQSSKSAHKRLDSLEGRDNSEH